MDKVAYSATEAPESWKRWSFGFFTEKAEDDSSDTIFLDGIRTQGEFLERLHFEKRRVDRSGKPLSMALFFLKEDLLGDSRRLRKFLVSMKKGTRETDLKGWARGKTSGLLLPDTDGPGAYRCLERVVKDPNKTVCDVLTGTYPGRIFHEILGKTGFEFGMLAQVGDRSPHR